MKRNVLPVFILLLLATSPFSLAEKVYKHVDEDGNVTYSDEPPTKNAKQIQVPSINTVPAIEIPEAAEAEVAEEEETDPAAITPYNLRIASPKDEYQVGPAEQIISVLLLTDKNLEDRHFFQLLIDGEVYEQASKSNSININVRRSLQGRRLITAAIVDENGTTYDTTPPISIQVVRPPIRPRTNP
ncbi:protein of unknown function [Alteromonadaceae bacterium Bs31]|nr:protein of unknown function [Alteromonadaceae bacterium Bs31]